MHFTSYDVIAGRPSDVGPVKGTTNVFAEGVVTFPTVAGPGGPDTGVDGDALEHCGPPTPLSTDEKQT